MKAVILGGTDRVMFADRPDPKPGPGEALIRVHAVGICGTDLELADGYMGFAGIPGHEFVGTVVQVCSPADSVLVGARVAGEINLGCLECRLCAEGMSRHCPTRRVLGILGKDGAMAEAVTLPVSNLHVVPESISDLQAVFVEPVAAAYEILDQVRVATTDRVLVLGDGRLGLLAAQVLAAVGARVTIAGKHASKLKIAASLGLSTIESPPAAGHDRFDLIVESTGSASALDQAIEAVRPRGTVVMKSTCSERTSFDAARAVVNEVTLIGSRCGRFEPAIRALAENTVTVDPLVSETLPLAEAAHAFRRAASGDVLKVVLRALA